MQFPKFQTIGLIGLVGISLSLSGCLFQQPAPEEVVAKFTQVMADTTSFHYDLNLKLDGRLPITVVKDVNSLDLKFVGDAVNKDPNQPQFTLQANVVGTSPQGSLGLSGELVNLADYTYFRLTNLALPTLLPVSLGADSRWYKIRHLALANPNEKKLGVADGQQFTPDQIQALRDLISQTPIAEVLEVLPDATVNGQRSYHYKVKLKSDAVVELLRQLNQTLGTKMTVPNSALIDKYQPEVWINKRTFRLAQFKLADLYLLDSVPVAFDLTLGLSRHNEKITIVEPTDTEELSTDRLFRTKLPF